MKVILVGYGKMGRLLDARLPERGHSVTAVVDPFVQAGAASSGAPVYPSLEEALKGPPGKGLADADVAVEFTKPGTAPENILFLTGRNIPVVTGTTGWYNRLPEITEKVNAAGSALLWASNFSLGVNLFYRIAAYAAKLADAFPEYDVGGYEIHHNKKEDSPSGTAKILVDRVLAQMKRKTKGVYEKLDRPPAADEIHYASLRAGSAPGIHTLIFDSPADTIELTHSARSREGLAAGAVAAAEWLVSRDKGGPARQGVFTMDQAIEDIIENIRSY
jgi:4-hydroxy-tetrahydrodipicolinate reductase